MVGEAVSSAGLSPKPRRGELLFAGEVTVLGKRVVPERGDLWASHGFGDQIPDELVVESRPFAVHFFEFLASF